jgi:hypothetical protein
MLSIGAIGGARLIEPIQNGDESPRYTVGRSVEVPLFGRFAVEADALYQRLGDTTAFTFSLAPGLDRGMNQERANSWEFPLGEILFPAAHRELAAVCRNRLRIRTISFHSDETRRTSMPAARPAHPPSTMTSGPAWESARRLSPEPGFKRDDSRSCRRSPVGVSRSAALPTEMRPG